MSAHKLRCVARTVQLRTDDGAEVANGDLHAAGRGAFRRAGDVDGGPGEDEGGGRVDASGAEEGAEVADAWVRDADGFDALGGDVRDGVRVAEEDCVADYGDQHGGYDEGGAFAGALADCGDDDCEDGGERVGRHGEELGFAGGVAEGFDDGGEEEGEGVEG